MKNLMIYRYWWISVFAAATTALIIGCVAGQVATVAVDTNREAEVEARNSNSKLIKAQGDSRVFIREEGWQIPKFASDKKSKLEPMLETKNGQTISIDLFETDLSPYLVTEEPFASIGIKLGKIQIQKVTEYTARDRTFCYKFLVNKVSVDEETNTVRSSSGSVFFFAYYDDDGDGKFESLYLDEPDKRGVMSFYAAPHAPGWLF